MALPSLAVWGRGGGSPVFLIKSDKKTWEKVLEKEEGFQIEFFI
jgi:hypothetical protein